jgi:hypothetical protein
MAHTLSTTASISPMTRNSERTSYANTMTPLSLDTQAATRLQSLSYVITGGQPFKRTYALMLKVVKPANELNPTEHQPKHHSTLSNHPHNPGRRLPLTSSVPYLSRKVTMRFW